MKLYLVKKLAKEKKTEYVKLVGVNGDYRFDITFESKLIVDILDIAPSRFGSICSKIDVDGELLVAELNHVTGGVK